jgi:hypothetical protein
MSKRGYHPYRNDRRGHGGQQQLEYNPIQVGLQQPILLQAAPLIAQTSNYGIMPIAHNYSFFAKLLRNKLNIILIT